MKIYLTDPNTQFIIFAVLGMWTAIVYNAGYKRDESIDLVVISGQLVFALGVIINVFRILISKL